MKKIILYVLVCIVFQIGNAQNNTTTKTKGITAEMEKRVLIPKGTIVTLSINQAKVSSSDLDVNSILRLEVAEPVFVDGEEVITKGAYAEGKIVKIKKHGSFGKGGEMIITATDLTAFDNQRIRLDGEPLIKKGRNRRGLAICVTLCCPIFPFVGSTIKGYPAEIEGGTRLKAFIASDVYAYSNPINSNIFEK